MEYTSNPIFKVRWLKKNPDGADIIIDTYGPFEYEQDADYFVQRMNELTATHSTNSRYEKYAEVPTLTYDSGATHG